MQHDSPGRPVGAALVRFVADDPLWIERVPPVPHPHLVTATLVGAPLADISSSILEARGVRIMGVEPTGAVMHATLLVPVDLAQEHPQWFHDLVRAADRAWDLRLGPVQTLFGDALAVHLRH